MSRFLWFTVYNKNGITVYNAILARQSYRPMFRTGQICIRPSLSYLLAVQVVQNVATNNKYVRYVCMYFKLFTLARNN